MTAGHAGVSRWVDRTSGVEYKNLNSNSIGIELANGGDSYPTKFSSLPPVKAKHKNGGPEREWESFPPAQLAAAEEVCKAIFRRYHIDDVVGHDEIAPGRKTDPGPAFPMPAFRHNILSSPTA
jgi:N-acetylmuramoyl-L-alanine amidase